MSNLAKIIDDLDSLSIQEKETLVTSLEERWGVKSSFVKQIDPSLLPAPEVVQQTEFTVVLMGFVSKIETIKEVRKLLGLDLKGAKDLVEASATSPQVLKADISREEADLLAGQLTANGAKIEIK